MKQFLILLSMALQSEGINRKKAVDGALNNTIDAKASSLLKACPIDVQIEKSVIE